MSIIANVKGYFMGGATRGVTSKPDLWSYEEIATYAQTLVYNQIALNELNQHPEDYFNLFLSDGKLILIEAGEYEPFCNYDGYELEIYVFDIAYTCETNVLYDQQQNQRIEGTSRNLDICIA